MLAIDLIPPPCSVIICYFQNNRKRKQPTSSGPANSTGTGNTVGPASSPPSTPSTHTPGDGLGMGGNMRHVPKNLMIYGADGTGLASSSNQMVTAFTLHLKYIVISICYIDGQHNCCM
jgi:hypothetical protein